MFSMTGYGKGEAREGGVEVRVEVRSVNNRYLDVAVKAPRVFLSAEEKIREIVREFLSRGHLDIFVTYTDSRERGPSFTVDENVVKSYLAASEELGRIAPSVPDDVTRSTLLRLPDVLRPEEQNGADETTLLALKGALKTALVSLTEMRRAEGERLKADLLSRMDTIEKLRERIVRHAPVVAENYREKLTSRIGEYLGGKVDETRILTEAAVFADKCNIDEELTRLSSHIREFHTILSEERAGKKLDFLIQEFNRECNTICSKSNDKEVTAAALDMKNEIEKVREQIQNLE